MFRINLVGFDTTQIRIIVRNTVILLKNTSFIIEFMGQRYLLNDRVFVLEFYKKKPDTWEKNKRDYQKQDNFFTKAACRHPRT